MCRHNPVVVFLLALLYVIEATVLLLFSLKKSYELQEAMQWQGFLAYTLLSGVFEIASFEIRAIS